MYRGINEDEWAKALKALPSQQGMCTRFQDFKIDRTRRSDVEKMSGMRADIETRKEYYEEVLGVLTAINESGVKPGTENKLKIDRWEGGKPVFDPVSDVLWVYQNLMLKEWSTPPPSPGALLLMDVAKDKMFFIQHIWGPIMKSTALKDLAKGLSDDGREQIELSRKLIDMLDDDVVSGDNGSK